MTLVKEKDAVLPIGRSVDGERRELDDKRWLYRAGGGALETTVDQALIRGLGTAFRDCVSGLSTRLKSGRRAEPGHVVSDGGSPPWLHPRRCAAGLQLLRQ